MVSYFGICDFFASKIADRKKAIESLRMPKGHSLVVSASLKCGHCQVRRRYAGVVTFVTNSLGIELSTHNSVSGGL
jgi:hypothetical protein